MITYPSGTTAPFPNACKIGNLFLTNSLAEVRTVFPTADKVGKLTVFNIGGNKARLLTAIHYNRHKVYIRAVLTHEAYDQNTWKE